MSPIDESLVFDTCGRNAYDRGYQYQQQGRVLAVSAAVDDNDELWIDARVKGSGSHVYRQEIGLAVSPRGRITLDGLCSCPVGHNCKHVAAVMLELIASGHFDDAGAPESAASGADERDARSAATLSPALRPDGTGRGSKPAAAQEPAADPLTDWQQELERLRQRPPQEAPSGRERLLYLLTPRRDASGRVELRLAVVKVRVLKHGGYGVASAYRPNYGYGGYYYPGYARYLGDADHDILRRLPDVPNERGARSEQRYLLVGADGAGLLRRLLATGRCHLLDKDSPALAPGPVRTPAFAWVQDDDGRYRLDARLDGVDAGWIALPLQPPWYLDPRRLKAGPLLTALDGEHFALLLRLPPQPEHALPRLARLLSRELPPDSVPLPAELPQVVVEQTAPVPLLTLRVDDGEACDGADATAPFADLRRSALLRFDYGGVELAPALSDAGAQTLFSRDDVDYRVRRDLDAEAAALAALLELGLQPLYEQLRVALPPDVESDDGDRLGIAFGLPQCAEDQQPLRWLTLLDHGLAALAEQGWRIDADDGFRPRVVDPQAWRSRLRAPSGQNWFELALTLRVDGRDVELLPLLAELLGEEARGADIDTLLTREHLLFALDDGSYLRLPSAQIRPVLAVLVELYDGAGDAAAASLRLYRQQAATLAELEQALGEQQVELEWRGGQKLRELGRRLRDFSGIETVPPPRGLEATLRGYQRRGLDWLQFLAGYGFGGILADDMGLGKTVQTLAHLLVEKRAGRLNRPALIVAPTSLMGNWRRECERFTPALSLLTLHGPKRRALSDRIDAHDLVLTTYPLLARDRDALDRPYRFIILDEAQHIKNPRSKTARTACSLRAERRLCLTGTPLENHLGELWSLFHFLMPGFLGDETRFNRLFRQPIEQHANATRRRELARRVRPFLLRRNKSEVAAELPPKTEIVQTVTLDGEQALLYESIRVAMASRVRSLLQKKGFARSRIDILDALLKLRQTCCDPRLVPLDAARGVTRSAKLELLAEMLPALLEDGRRVLLFSQFTSMLALIEARLKTLGIRYSKLTGRTRKRDDAIAAFQDGKVPVFLVSLKAGGVGLNLTAADAVILYDPWWNPAAEQQAIDRAYRIGQDKPVFVYKYISEKTVEEKMLALQAQKQALADGVYDGDGAASALDADEILALFQPLR